MAFDKFKNYWNMDIKNGVRGKAEVQSVSMPTESGVAEPEVIDLGAAGVPPGMEDQIRAAMEMAQQYIGQMPDADASGNVVLDRLSQLERLAKLRESGALTDEEFEAEKAKLLGA